MDAVFRALADPTRRQLLDSLYARNGQTLNALCERMDMTRQAVTKHLAILEEANLVTTVRKGREKEHYLNPVPINEIAERWIEELFTFAPGNESERNGWLFCLAHLARRSGLRAIDVSDLTRERVVEVLKANPGPAAWQRMVKEVVSDGGEEQARMFGDALPIGLRLAQSG